jgi:putative pyruvate formate lyase activating enzyme
LLPVVEPSQHVNLMAQYRPAGLVGSCHGDGNHETARQPNRDEYDREIEFADDLGLKRLDPRSRASALLLPRLRTTRPGFPITSAD